MQFKEFDWLSGHGIWAIIPCRTIMVSAHMKFWGNNFTNLIYPCWCIISGTWPLLVANFLLWYVADSICYTAVHFFDNFIGDFTNESALWLHPNPCLFHSWQVDRGSFDTLMSISWTEGYIFILTHQLLIHEEWSDVLKLEKTEVVKKMNKL